MDSPPVCDWREFVSAAFVVVRYFNFGFSASSFCPSSSSSSFSSKPANIQDFSNTNNTPIRRKKTTTKIMPNQDHEEQQQSINMNRKEVVVVTGSSGCLGFHTLKLLISHDDQVGEIRCLDWRDMEPVKMRSIKCELEQFERQTKRKKLVKFIRGDIRDINVVERTLDGADCILHCAAKIDIWRDTHEQDVSELESVNVCGTENLLKSAIRFGVGKFVHVSSFEAFTGYPTVYYATENTLPDPNSLLFGPSGLTKKQAEEKVIQFSNNKLSRPARLDSGKDSLNAIVVRFTPMYGEHDEYFVSKVLRVAKFFGGKLQRFTNVWIRQQPIYVGNAAWSLIRAKQQMDLDQSISGEDFNITDETAIGDPFDFFEQFAQTKGMRVSKSTYPAMPVFLLIWLFFAMRRFVSSLDLFGLFSMKKTRLQEAMEQDEKSRSMSAKKGGLSDEGGDGSAVQTHKSSGCKSVRWHHLIKPQIFFFMCNSLFLNRTKASLRLKYEPLFDPKESLERSIDWYKNHFEL